MNLDYEREAETLRDEVQMFLRGCVPAIVREKLELRQLLRC